MDMKREKSLSVHIVFRFISLITLCLLLVSCSPPGQTGERGEPIIFADPGWESIKFHSAVARFIIENGYDRATDVLTGSTPATFTGLRTGDIDTYMELWTDNVIEEYTDMLESGDVIELSVNFEDNEQGWYVPTYVIEGDPERGIEPMAPDLKSVQDLPKYWELFQDPEDPSKGRIFGAEAGWEVDNTLAVKMETYNLDENFNYFRPGSDAAITSAITRAFQRREAWVGYYWDPTWVTGTFDLTLLEEPEFTQERWENGFACEFPSNRVVVAANSGLPDKAPEVVDFLKNYKTSSALTAEALAYMEDNDASIEEAAKWFLTEHEEIWTTWVSDEIAEKVKGAI